MRALAACVLASALAACQSPPHAPDCPFGEPLSREVAAADVVFFGESHDQRLHHDAERDLLACMADGRPLLLGMEMFQRRFQEPLDDYVAGRIDEREMLRRTEYFTRWNFDHTLYAPLWRFAREHGIRVVALNADGATIAKIRTGSGIAGLSPEERAQIAADIDLTNAEHRARVEDQFKKAGHPLSQLWYESMTAWDETMAESAARSLAAAGPDARMLVVAGRGHIEEFTGIPDRVLRRRPAARRVVVLAETDDQAAATSVRREGEEWIVTLPEREDPPAPKLAVSFDTAHPRDDGLLVQSVVEGGTAAKGGVVAGDVLVQLDSDPVRDLTDVRLFLDPHRTGDTVVATVLRDGRTCPLMLTLEPPPAPPAAAPTK